MAGHYDAGLLDVPRYTSPAMKGQPGMSAEMQIAARGQAAKDELGKLRKRLAGAGTVEYYGSPEGKTT